MQHLIIGLFTGLALAACAKTVPTAPPVQGPAVISDASVEIEDWEYLGPDAVESFPQPSTKVREVGNDVYQAWLIQKDDGFELVWSQFICATQPVVVVHHNASIEFWPGKIVGDDCVARGSFHKLTVKTPISIPLEQWTFTLHPPPEPDA